MEKIIEYKKLLRQRASLIEELGKQKDVDSQNEIDAQIHDIDEVLELMINSSPELMKYVNGATKRNEDKEATTTSSSEQKSNEKTNWNKIIKKWLIAIVTVGAIIISNQIFPDVEEMTNITKILNDMDSATLLDIGKILSTGFSCIIYAFASLAYLIAGTLFVIAIKDE